TTGPYGAGTVRVAVVRRVVALLAAPDAVSADLAAVVLADGPAHGFLLAAGEGFPDELVEGHGSPACWTARGEQLGDPQPQAGPAVRRPADGLKRGVKVPDVRRAQD